MPDPWGILASFPDYLYPPLHAGDRLCVATEGTDQLVGERSVLAETSPFAVCVKPPDATGYLRFVSLDGVPRSEWPPFHYLQFGQEYVARKDRGTPGWSRSCKSGRLNQSLLEKLKAAPPESCRDCGAQVRRNYCRQCDVFFLAGHAEGCGP